LTILCAILLPAFNAMAADVNASPFKLPAIFGNHMVLQRGQTDPIWGWDAPGTKVSVTFSGQSCSAMAGADRKWIVKLAPLPANATPQVLRISGTSKHRKKNANGFTRV